MTAVVRPLIHLGVEDGQQGFAIWTSAFFISYILLVNVVLLNVAVAVLLEGFLSSMADCDMEVKATLGIQEYAKISGSLDPLIASFSSFDSADQLRQMIRKLFQYLDVDASDSLSFLEFKMGLETLDMKPTLCVTEEDWDHFTGHGKYLDDDQALDASRFEECMRQELKAYSQRIISHQMRQAIVYCKENSLDYLAHKMQLAEVYAISNQLSDLIHDLNKNGLPLSNSSSGRGGGELKEMRDLLKTLAAEQKHLRMDVLCQQGDWTEVKDLLQQLADEQTQLRVLLQTKVGGGVEGTAGPPGVRFHAHEENPKLMSAPRIFTAKEPQESPAHCSDTGRGGGNSTKVRFTSASERDECGSTAEEDYRHFSVPIREEGSCHLSVPILGIREELKGGESPFLKFHTVRASGGRDDSGELKKHLDNKLSRLRETHGRVVGKKGLGKSVQPQNGNGGDSSSKSFADSTFDGVQLCVSRACLRVRTILSVDPAYSQTPCECAPLSLSLPPSLCLSLSVFVCVCTCVYIFSSCSSHVGICDQFCGFLSLSHTHTLTL